MKDIKEVIADGNNVDESRIKRIIADINTENVVLDPISSAVHYDEIS